MKNNELKDYFKHLEISDLKYFSADFLVQSVKPEHKLLMHLFAKKEIANYLDQDDTCDIDIRTEGIMISETPSEEQLSPNIANYRGQLVSILFSQHRFKKTIPMIVDEIDRPVEFLDLSDNSLMDADMTEIKKLVEKIRPTVVNLAGNRFHGYDQTYQAEVDQALKDILAIEDVKFVDITCNPIASIDRSDLFDTFTEKDFQKLVWVPQHYLTGGVWKNIVSNSAFHNKIVETHFNYAQKQW
jgi:hypothetical protein